MGIRNLGKFLENMSGSYDRTLSRPIDWRRKELCVSQRNTSKVYVRTEMYKTQEIPIVGTEFAPW